MDMHPTNAGLRLAAEEFLYQEARLLDAGRWRDWQKLLTEDCLYWIPGSLTDYDPRRHISFIYDDYGLLNERLKRLESGHAYAQEPPSRTLHQISNISCELREDHVLVRSNLVLFEFKPNAQRRMEPVNVFPAACEHDLVGSEGDWKIRRKKVVLLAADGTITNLTFLI
jgi:3-phenylpropionate/cinnamic acid dioxygenase small subunit